MFRRSSILEARDLAAKLYQAGIQTIVFAKSRVSVERLVTYLKQLTKNKIADESIQGYRGGYLPSGGVKLKKVCEMAQSKLLLVRMPLN